MVSLFGAACQCLDRAGIMGLAEGQRVAIDVAQGQKGPEAVGLRLI
jgi:cold shock CspA family protein